VDLVIGWEFGLIWILPILYITTSRALSASVILLTATYPGVFRWPERARTCLKLGANLAPPFRRQSKDEQTNAAPAGLRATSSADIASYSQTSKEATRASGPNVSMHSCSRWKANCRAQHVLPALGAGSTQAPSRTGKRERAIPNAKTCVLVLMSRGYGYVMRFMLVERYWRVYGAPHPRS
jgi:hypothetical protein